MGTPSLPQVRNARGDPRFTDGGFQRRHSMSGTATLAGKMRRLEDPALITGKGQYVSDIRRPGMLYVSFVRSIYPHARINNIDVSAAQAHPGVVMVVTAKEIEHLGGLLTAMGPDSQWTPQPSW